MTPGSTRPDIYFEWFTSSMDKPSLLKQDCCPWRWTVFVSCSRAEIQRADQAHLNYKKFSEAAGRSLRRCRATTAVITTKI
jgi:hypothetical protein